MITAVTALAALPALAAGWSELPPRNFHRAEGQLVALQDGRILQLGGFDGYWPFGAQPTDDCEILDPDTDVAWTQCEPIPKGMAMFWAALLPSGNVVVAGNFQGTDDAEGMYSFVYVTSTGHWVTPASHPDRRGVSPHSIMNAPVLGDGRVLIAGGFRVEGTGDNTFFDDSFLFTEDAAHPERGHWDRTTDRGGNVTKLPFGITSSGVIRLADGRVLIAGGLDGFRNGDFVTTAKAAVFDPRSGTWSRVADMPATGEIDDTAASDPDYGFAGGPDSANGISPGSRWMPAIARLGGDALVAGGRAFGVDDGGNFFIYGRRSALRFNSDSGTWSMLEPTAGFHQIARAVNLDNANDVLVIGGFWTGLAERFQNGRGWSSLGNFVDLPSCDLAPFPDCFALDEFGGQLRKTARGDVVQSCGYDYTRDFPDPTCNRAFIYRPAR